MPEGAASLETALERLYAAPLTAFVAERKAIARELRAAGDRDGARTIEKIQRPSVAAWTLNQLARSHPRELATFLECVDRQLAGSIEAREDEKRVLAELLDRARELLEDDGHTASRANLERVMRALRSAAVDRDQRVLLERGRLVSEPEQGDALNVLAALAPRTDAVAPRVEAPARARPKPKEEPEPEPKQEPKQAPKKPDTAFARSARAHASRSPIVSDAAERRAALERAIEALRAERRVLALRLERLDDELARRVAELERD